MAFFRFRRSVTDSIALFESILMLTDAITHGSAARTNAGYRRITLYRYSPRFLRSRFHYVPSKKLLESLDDEQRGIIQPIPPRFAPEQKI